MRYGVSSWAYEERGALLVEELAGLGFDAISFQPSQVLGLSGDELKRLLEAMDGLGLVATIHSAFSVSPEDLERVHSALGERLVTITFDAAKLMNSVGWFYDASRMGRTLVEVERRTRGTSLRFGVEDFPLDAVALDHYRDELAPVLECPRFGMLADIGHLNMRLAGEEYFAGNSVADYLKALPLEVIEVHLHDNNGDKDSHGYFGFGNVAFSQIAEGLAAIGFDGVSTLEIHPPFHGSTPAETKPRARDSLAKWRELWAGFAPSSAGKARTGASAESPPPAL